MAVVPLPALVLPLVPALTAHLQSSLPDQRDAPARVRADLAAAGGAAAAVLVVAGLAVAGGSATGPVLLLALSAATPWVWCRRQARRLRLLGIALPEFLAALAAAPSTRYS